MSPSGCISALRLSLLPLPLPLLLLFSISRYKQLLALWDKNLPSLQFLIMKDEIRIASLMVFQSHRDIFCDTVNISWPPFSNNKSTGSEVLGLMLLSFITPSADVFARFSVDFCNPTKKL